MYDDKLQTEQPVATNAVCICLLLLTTSFSQGETQFSLLLQMSGEAVAVGALGSCQYLADHLQTPLQHDADFPQYALHLQWLACTQPLKSHTAEQQQSINPTVSHDKAAQQPFLCKMCSTNDRTAA